MPARRLIQPPSFPSRRRKSFKRAHSPIQRTGHPNRQAPRARARPQGRRQDQLGSEAGRLRNQTGCRPRQAGRGGSLEREAWKDVQKGDRWVLATEDVRDCFPSIPLDLAASSLNRILGRPILANFLLTLIRGNEGGQRTVGLDQGNPLSPTVMNAVLHFALDSPYRESNANPPLWPYADNLVVATHTVAEGQQAVTLLG